MIFLNKIYCLVLKFIFVPFLCFLILPKVLAADLDSLPKKSAIDFGGIKSRIIVKDIDDSDYQLEQLFPLQIDYSDDKINYDGHDEKPNDYLVTYNVEPKGYYYRAAKGITNLVKQIDSSLDAVILGMNPIKPVEAGGIGYVVNKIVKETKRVLKQFFRLLNKSRSHRPGIGVRFDDNGRPYVSDFYVDNSNGERFIIYENHNPDGSTTWQNKAKLPDVIVRDVKNREKNSKGLQQDSSEKIRNQYDYIDARDVLFKGLGIFVEPKYAAQEGGLGWNLARGVKVYPGQKIYQMFGWDYELPENYYNYGYYSKLSDAHTYGFKLASRFFEYDNKVKSYGEGFLPEYKRSELRAYERNEWDSIMSETVSYLFANGMWNDKEVRKEFEDGFVAGSKSFLGNEYDKFIEHRKRSVITNIQNEFKFEMNRGFGLLFDDVEKYLKDYLNNGGINEALREISRGQFTSELSETASQLLEMDSDDFESTSEGGTKLYRFEKDGKEYTFKLKDGEGLREFFEKAKDVADDFGEKTKELFEKLSTMEPKRIDNIVGAPVDFPSVKRKVVTSAMLGGGLSLKACSAVCKATTAATGGIIGIEQGAVAGTAGGPAGIMIGSGIGGIVGSTIGYTGGQVACDSMCVGLSQNARAIKDSSEYIYYSKSEGEGNKERVVNPSKGESKVWKELKLYKGDIKTNGLTGKDREYYKWDRLHNDIEVYDRNGRHLGSKDPKSGKMYKSAKSTHDIKGEL